MGVAVATLAAAEIFDFVPDPQRTPQLGNSASLPKTQKPTSQVMMTRGPSIRRRGGIVRRRFSQLSPVREILPNALVLQYELRLPRCFGSFVVGSQPLASHSAHFQHRRRFHRHGFSPMLRDMLPDDPIREVLEVGLRLVKTLTGFPWRAHHHMRELNRRRVPKDHRASTVDWDRSCVIRMLRSEKYVGLCLMKTTSGCRLNVTKKDDCMARQREHGDAICYPG